MEKSKTEERKPHHEERRLEPCQHAYCCAEHARFSDENDPCNDGRGAFIYGRRKDDPKLGARRTRRR